MSKIDNKKMHILFNQYKMYKNEKNLEKIYKEYYNLAYSIAFLFLKNKENTEDVVQNVFIKIFRMKIENLPDCNEASWFYTVVKNESLNFLKKYKDYTNIEEIYNIKDSNDEIDKITDILYFNKIIKDMSIQEKEIFSLKILSDLSFNDISKLLNLSIGTVQWKYYKSVKNIKSLISSLIIFIISFTYGLLNIREKEVIIEKPTEMSKENDIYNNTTNNIIENDLADRLPQENSNNTVQEIDITDTQVYYEKYINGIGIISFVLSSLCVISIIITLIKNRNKH